MNPANNKQAWKMPLASGEYRSPGPSPDVSLLKSWAENLAPPHLDFWLQSEVREVLIAQSCLTLCDPMDCNPSSSSIHGILQAWILEWVATPFLGDLPDPGIELGSSALAGIFFTCSGYKTMI